MSLLLESGTRIHILKPTGKSVCGRVTGTADNAKGGDEDEATCGRCLSLSGHKLVPIEKAGDPTPQEMAEARALAKEWLAEGYKHKTYPGSNRPLPATILALCNPADSKNVDREVPVFMTEVLARRKLGKVGRKKKAA